MIKEWLNEYAPKNQEEASQALREIMQEMALAGLNRSGFFENAAFYGGTALRILHGLNRFSEDLDFSLLKVQPDFPLEPHLLAIEQEFIAAGMKVSVKEKEKTNRTAIESAFLKPETVWKELVLEDVIAQNNLDQKPRIKIKLEIDTKPPLGFKTEEKLLIKPFSFYVKSFTLPNLFAGKMHALLFRKWKTNVKGRDWYDMEWYIRKGIPMNFSHFVQRAKDSGDWKNKSMTSEDFHSLLLEKIKQTSINRMKEDVIRFIKDPQTLDIWSPTYFSELVNGINIEQE